MAHGSWLYEPCAQDLWSLPPLQWELVDRPHLALLWQVIRWTPNPTTALFIHSSDVTKQRRTTFVQVAILVSPSVAPIFHRYRLQTEECNSSSGSPSPWFISAFKMLLSIPGDARGPQPLSSGPDVSCVATPGLAKRGRHSRISTNPGLRAASLEVEAAGGRSNLKAIGGWGFLPCVALCLVRGSARGLLRSRRRCLPK